MDAETFFGDIMYIINDYFHKLRSMTFLSRLMTRIKCTCTRAINMKADTINAYEEERKIHRVHEAFRRRVARLRLSNAAQCIYTGNTITGSHHIGNLFYSSLHIHIPPQA